MLSIFTDATNRDVDFTKTATGIGIAVFFALSIYDYGFRSSPWNPTDWCLALAGLIGVGGGVSKIKDVSGTPKDPS